MIVRTELFNINSDGVKVYLSAGQFQLPLFFLLFFFSYLALTVFWVYKCFSSKPLTHCLHKFLVILLIIKDLYLICAAVYKHNVKFAGVSRGFDMWVYIFQFTYIVGLSTIIVLINSGWCFMNPFLQIR